MLICVEVLSLIALAGTVESTQDAILKELIPIVCAYKESPPPPRFHISWNNDAFENTVKIPCTAV